MKTCTFHGLLVEKLANIETTVRFIKERLEEDRSRVKTHIHEGECEGGFRDRLQNVEQTISAMKKAEWVRVSVAAVVGGLIARTAPDIIWKLIETGVRSLWHG